MSSTMPYVARYRAAWAATTRVVLGTGVGIVAACFVLLLPWLSAVLMLGGWVGRRRLDQLFDEVRAAAAGSEAAVLLSVGLLASVGWTILLGPAGAAVVVVTMLGVAPLLLDRLREHDRRPRGRRASEPCCWPTPRQPGCGWCGSGRRTWTTSNGGTPNGSRS